MNYKKKIEGVVYKTFADGNTFYHGDGTESTSTETQVFIDDSFVIKFEVHNQYGKSVKIDKTTLEKLGFKVEIN